jgi:hypothetical protein
MLPDRLNEICSKLLISQGGPSAAFSSFIGRLRKISSSKDDKSVRCKILSPETYQLGQFLAQIPNPPFNFLGLTKALILNVL